MSISLCSQALAASNLAPDGDLIQSLPIDKEVVVGTLDNGLTYYVRRNVIPENKVELRLVVNVGSILEEDNERGLSHFLEHMAFNGSPHFPNGELIKRLEDVGVRLGKELNAYTSFDETVYSLPIAADKFDMGLSVIADWAMNLTLDSAAIDKERGVILEELRLGRGASVRIREQYLPVLFSGSRYPLRLPIGKADVIANFPYEALRSYYKRWYRPDLMAVVIVGDIDTTETVVKLRKIFSQHPAPADAPTRLINHVPEHNDFRVVVATDNETAGTSVEISYKHRPVTISSRGEYIKQSIYDVLFSSMINARLNELCDTDNPPFSDVESGYSSYFRGVDTYSSYARCPQQGITRALETLATENERVLRYGFLSTEMERAKVKFLARCRRVYLEREKFASDRYADAYQMHFLMRRPIFSTEYEYELINEVLAQTTVDTINALAKEYFTLKNRTVVITGPAGEGIVYPTEEELRSTVEAAAQQRVKPYSERKQVAQLMKSTPKPGVIVGERNDSDSGITEWQLSNGATVVFKATSFKNNEILMRSTSNGGYSMFAGSDDMSALYATKIQDESGVNGINNTQLKRLLAGKNISLTQSLVLYNESMSGRFEPEEEETFFQLLYLYHTAPFFDKKAFARVMKRERAEYAKLLDNPLNYFNYEIDKVISNGNPRRKRWPVGDNLNNVNFARAKSIYRKRFGNAAGFTFVFVGNIDIEKMKPYILTYIGGLPSSPKRKCGYNEQQFVTPDGPQQYVFRKGVDEKVNVSLRFAQKVDWDKQRSFNYSAFVEILNSRLFESLRQEMSGVYGVRVSGTLQREHEGEAQLGLAFGTNTESYRALIDRAILEVDRLIVEGPSSEELSRVQEKRRIALAADLKQNSTWLIDIQRSYRYGDGVEGESERKSYIETLSAEGVMRAGKECVNTSKVLEFVLLPQ